MNGGGCVLASGQSVLGWCCSAGQVLGWGSEVRGGRSTWQAKCPPACLASCDWGFPAPHQDRHWGATVGWGPSLQLWLSPRGTCRTLEASYERKKTKRVAGSCKKNVNLRGGCGQNVAGKLEKKRFMLFYLRLSRPPHLRLLSVEMERQQCHTWEVILQNWIHCKPPQTN